MNKEKYPLNDNCQKYYRCPKAEPRAILPVAMEKQAALEKVSCREKVAEQVTTQKYIGGKAWEN